MISLCSNFKIQGHLHYLPSNAVIVFLVVVPVLGSIVGATVVDTVGAGVVLNAVVDDVVEGCVVAGLGVVENCGVVEVDDVG